MKNCYEKAIQKTNGKQGEKHINLILTKKVRKENRILQSLYKTHFWKNQRRGIKSGLDVFLRCLHTFSEHTFTEHVRASVSLSGFGTCDIVPIFNKQQCKDYLEKLF